MLRCDNWPPVDQPDQGGAQSGSLPRVVEEIGHDRAVDAEVLGQGELAPTVPWVAADSTWSAAWTAGRSATALCAEQRRRPETVYPSPAEIICQRVVTSAWVVGRVP